MKKHLLAFALLLFFTTQSKAQTSVYHPFPSNQAIWGNQFYDDVGQPTIWFYYLTMQGDTTIGGQVYKKIFDGPYYHSALRESNKIIYSVLLDSTKEYVLYNFNVNAGDSIFYDFYVHDTLVVDQIDSVNASDGYHRALQLHGLSGGWAVWIEGLGSSTGLFEPIYFISVSGRFHLVCFQGDNNTAFLDYYSPCLTGMEDFKHIESSFSLYPNPATNQLTITSSFHNEAVSVSIMNMLGQETLSYSLSFGEGRGEALDVSKLKAGIYFLQLKGESGMVVKKFVKE